MNFKSGFERTLAASLRTRNVEFEYETLGVPYVLDGTYWPDFKLVNSGVWIEAKGLLDRESKRKMLAVKKQHPELDIRIVFMDAGKRIPGSKQSHADWARKNGFQFADKEIPEAWLNE